jgi:2-dehydropantoate 2-reductase
VRFIVFGAGAIGGVIGARLQQSGREVVLIARGAQLEAIRAGGLRVEGPEGATTLRMTAVAEPAEARVRGDDVMLLAVKSHQTAEALDALRRQAPPEIAVACAQNGVANECAALRFFANVYGISVLCPTAFLAPGVVEAYAAPVPGILDVGRYPSGIDGVTGALSAAFRAAGFDSQEQPDVMRWKHGKLLDNLGNAVEAACGPEARTGALGRLARAEGEACLRAAGIAFAERDPLRSGAVKPRPIGGRARPGGSTWQSLARGSGSVETDYLNGEVVRLGRLHGFATPVNETLQRLTWELARERRAPGSVSEAALLEQVRRPHS